MSQIVRLARYFSARSLARQGLDARWSDTGEVIAALLGYRSLALLGHEYAESRMHLFLDNAQILVLNEHYGHARAAQLMIGWSIVEQEVTVQTCIECLIQSASQAAVYVGIEDFYSCWASEALAEAIFSADDVALSPMPMAWPEMSCEIPQSEDLWSCAHDWEIEGRGTVQELVEATKENVGYASVFLNVTGRLVFCKAGRAGLIFIHAEGACVETVVMPWLSSRCQLTPFSAPPFTLLH